MQHVGTKSTNIQGDNNFVPKKSLSITCRVGVPNCGHLPVIRVRITVFFGSLQ